MISIALITDDNYFPYALTTIQSVLETTSEDLQIFCVVTDVNQEKINCAYNFFQNDNIKFIYYDYSSISTIKPKNHVSLAAYLKILLPDILKNIDKVIFLDSDLYLLNDIKNLWSMFDDKYFLQACWNPGYNYDNHVFGLDDSEKTFNSGVMLLNLEKIRLENKVIDLIDFIENKNELTFLNDQAAFNAVFAKEWGELPIKWNVQYKFYLGSYEYFSMSKSKFKEIINYPSIVHFTTSSKPWMFRNAHPFKKKFIKTYEQVNGKIYYKDISFNNFLKKVNETRKIYINSRC